ncbi:MAG: TonB-dependent receptor plug domain-containing protein, partial [Flavihumibacter sp.]
MRYTLHDMPKQESGRSGVGCLMLSFLFAGLLQLFVLGLSAQGIVGYVKGDDKKALAGATVNNLRTGSHSHCNESGFFRLSDARRGDSLRITQVSYLPLTVKVDNDTLRLVLTATAFQLNEVSITATVNHFNIIAAVDLQTNPVNTSQELLRKVPGLFIGQHAGGGKAEQLFLRGFDIDHGTDINISVDGMPVNMLSHAHGQGYADLHFLIPETVDKIDFDKGPYTVSKGNLATAGYVAFQTKDRLDNSSVTLEAGKFNTYKMQGLFSLLNSERQSAWVAADYMLTDGYFVAPQHFNRLNLAGKYTAYLNGGGKLSLGFSHLGSTWDASGQIPQRAVDEKLITRFGSIDSTEGGTTHRTNLNLQFEKRVDERTLVKTSAWFTRYDFDLFSNFTFFLNDPVHGDQIRQTEKRNMAGFESVLENESSLSGLPAKIQAGIGFRNDAVSDIGLSHTLNRYTTLEELKLGNINETNMYGFAGAEIRKGRWLFNPAARIDFLKFTYNDKLATAYTNQSQQQSIVSPKFNIFYNQNERLQYFLKLGKGFHSNDTRVVVAQSGYEILPAAYGADLGMIWKPASRLLLNAALWYLYLQQEFVYVGDEGVVEPGGKTRRQGLDFGLRYQLGRYIFANGDFTYTHARSPDAEKGEDYIPLAPRLTFAGS